MQPLDCRGAWFDLIACRFHRCSRARQKTPPVCTSMGLERGITCRVGKAKRAHAVRPLWTVWARREGAPLPTLQAASISSEYAI